MIKVSDYIFDFLKSKGIDTIFSVSGGAAAHLLNSVKEKEFKYICNYHEQACAMAAEGYARIANKPACVLVTNGPGSSNTITGVLGAFQDSIPMIVISGQVPVNQSLGSVDIELRQLGVQECDIISMVKPITKYAVQITDPNTVANHLAIAYNTATTGRMGPVWLDIPLDVQSALTEPTADWDITNIPNISKYDPKEIIDLRIAKKKSIERVRPSKVEGQAEAERKEIEDTLKNLEEMAVKYNLKLMTTEKDSVKIDGDFLQNVIVVNLKLKIDNFVLEHIMENYEKFKN
jgi:acetolactate synthase-1/2/3 large subunit